MSKRRQRLPGADSQGILPYRIDPEPLTGATSFSGLPLLAEAFRALGLDTEVPRLVGIKRRNRGPTDAQMVESFLLMLVGGGECIDDLKRLREEPALGELLGYVPPPPDGGRHFLYGFHDETIMAGRPATPNTAWVPAESKPLDEGREYAEVLFVPATVLFEPNEIAPDRYIAIRKRPRQPTLWEQDGYSYWAVVTNLDWKAKAVLEWHRGKAGTIEHFHLVALLYVLL